MLTVEPVAVRLQPNQHRRFQAEAREDPVPMKAAIVAAAGMAAPFFFIAQPQFEEFRAEDIVRPQRHRRFPEAMALLRASHPDVEFAEQQDVGRHSPDEGAAAIEMMESLYIPVSDPQRPGSRADGTASGFEHSECLHLFHKLAVRLSISRQRQHDVARRLTDAREVGDRFAMHLRGTSSEVHL
jgi:hypothetical protein